MKRDYNRNTTSDMPMDSVFNSVVTYDEQKKNSKQKINAIGAKAKQQLKFNNKQTSLKENSVFAQNSYSADFQDLEKMNEEHSQSYRYKKRRNRVFIVLLVVMLILALASVVSYTTINKLNENCMMYVHGADATYIVNDTELSKFRAPSGLQGKRILKLDIKLRIEESGQFDVKFIPKCYKKAIRLSNILIYNGNYDLFYEGLDGCWYSIEPISGNKTIRLCGGIILDDDYDGTLTVDNFKMEFYTYLDKV